MRWTATTVTSCIAMAGNTESSLVMICAALCGELFCDVFCCVMPDETAERLVNESRSTPP